MTKTRKIQPWRRFAEISQAVIIIGLPFLKIKGESALRFDIPAQQLHFFGITLWMEEFFVVLIVIIFLSLLVIFITLVFGRIWCGWLCPQTVICDFTAYLITSKHKGFFNKVIVSLSVLVTSIFVSANLIWYFVSPYEFIPSLLAWKLGNIIWGFWFVLSVILFLNFVWLRQEFCATVCPYAKLQSTLFDSRTLLIAFDPGRSEECIECMACVKTCPVGIDIRSGTNAACIHCAECVDRCSTVMEPRQKKSLIGYFFGLPGKGGRILRQNVVMLGTVTAAFLAFFIYLLITRAPLDMTVLPNHEFQPRTNAVGSVINSYIISIRNRGAVGKELTIRIDGIAGTVRVAPDTVLRISAGESMKVPIYVSLQEDDGKEKMRDINIIIESNMTGGQSISKKASFIIPDRT